MFKMNQNSKIMNTAINSLLKGAIFFEKYSNDNIEELGFEYKENLGNDPVTIIDKSSEKAILDFFTNSEFSHISINSEEAGLLEKKESNEIIHVDPCDGTKNIKPQYGASTIGLSYSKDNNILIGAILNPYNKTLVYSEKGNGAFKLNLGIVKNNDGTPKEFDIISKPIQLNTTFRNNPSERIIMVDGYFNDINTPRKTGFMSEARKLAANFRMTGSNLDHAMKVINSQADIYVVDSVGGFWDVSPGVPILEELGGIVLDLDGNKPTKNNQLVVGMLDKKIVDSVLEIANKYYGQKSQFGEYFGHNNQLKK